MQDTLFVNDSDPTDGITPLGRACYDGDTAGLHRLLGCSVNPNRPIYPLLGWTITPLIAAIDACANGCVRALLEAGADPNVVCDDFDCSLHGRARCTPLLLADITCNAPARRLLLRHGADPQLAERFGMSAQAFRPDRNVRAKFLVSGVRVARMIRRRLSPGTIERALKRVRDLDEEDGQLLRTACDEQRSDIVELLLAYGADPNRSWPIALREADDESDDIPKLLLQAGYHADTAALIDAAVRGHPRIIELLIGFGADPNVAATLEGAGWTPTPLIAAILSANIECVRALLAHGAHPDLGCTGFPSLDDYDTRAANPLLSWYQHRHDPCLPGSTTCTPLMIASGMGNEAALRLLLQHGASPSVSDSQGRTALDYTCLGGDPQVQLRIKSALESVRHRTDSGPLF